jgi:signal transduction histidine kinase
LGGRVYSNNKNTGSEIDSSQVMKYSTDTSLTILLSSETKSDFRRFRNILIRSIFTIRKLCWVWLFFSHSSFTNAQTFATLKDADEPLNITGETYFLQDSTRNLSISDVIKPETNRLFKRKPEKIPNFGYPTSPVWIKITLQNNLSEPAWLEFERPLIDSITLFYQDEKGSYQSIQAGSKLPPSSRIVFFSSYVFPLNHAVKTPVTYYMRISTRNSLAVLLKMGSLHALSKAYIHDLIIMVLFFGMIIIFIIFNIFNFIIFRDRAYLYFTFYVALLSVNLFYLKGYFIYFYPLHHYVEFFSRRIWYLTDIFIILFAIDFLKINVALPLCYKIYKAIIFYLIAMLLLDFLQISFLKPLGWITRFVEPITSYSLIICGFIIYRKGNKSALFYVIGWGVFVHCVLFRNLSHYALLPFYVFTPSILQIGSFIEILCFGVGLIYKFNQMRQDTEEVLKENLLLIKEQNVILEKKVYERTLELNEKNSEISAQNEELIQQQEQLSNQRDTLEKQNQELIDFHTIIEEQSREIFLKNLELESEVEVRTQQLSLANRELITYNNQLEQFAFATAHNLRSPVARILGLGNVLALTNTPESEKDFIISQIIKSTYQLDNVIRDINQILEVRKNTNVVFVSVNLHESIKKVKDLLLQEILDTEASIIEDFGTDTAFMSFPPYIESILYNLISNAIKYRQISQVPQIVVRFERREKSSVLLTVADNGMGIDIKGNETKMFNLYRRFHTHVEGRGIGLYLVKTQVIALGGEIHISSVVNEGTAFTITLPENIPSNPITKKTE